MIERKKTLEKLNMQRGFYMEYVVFINYEIKL